MFIAYSPPTLLYLALPVGVFAVAVAAIVRISARQTQEKQALATRRGWIFQSKPEKDISWRIGGDGIWTLDAVLTRASDEFITTYTFSATRRRDSARDSARESGELRIQSRKMAQWIEGRGGQGALQVAQGLGKVMGAAFEERARELAATEFAEFSRPDMTEFRLMRSGISARQALELVGEGAQTAYLSWRASLPPQQQNSPNLRIHIEPDALRVTSTEPLESAARIEAFLEFCTALKR